MSGEDRPPCSVAAAPRSRWTYLLLALILLGTAALRVRLLGAPLERDEGEYAYAGQLFLQGVPPYQLAYNMKLPGIYAVYAGILAMFGETPQGIHLGLLLANAGCTLLVFLLARRMFADATALLAAGSFALLSLTRQIQGFTANAEPFVLLPALGGILLLLRAFDRQRRSLLWTGLSGILLGAAFVIKQHGILFALFAGLLLTAHLVRTKPVSRKRFLATAALFAACAALPFALTCLILFLAGVFDTFWFWTFEYAREYVGLATWRGGLHFFTQRFSEIAGSALPFWAASGVGAAALWIRRDPNKRFLTALFLFSFAAVSIGFYYRPHYFILLVPAAALLSAYGMDSLCRIIASSLNTPVRCAIFAGLFLAAAGFTVYQQRSYLFFDTPNQIVRTVYGSMPFPESPEIADFIRRNSGPADTIAVIGSEPQIYFYSGRRAATGYIYTYPLMEEHPFARSMQHEMIREIEKADPEFLLWVNIGASWQWREHSHRDIFSWLERYTAGYDTVGVIDILYTADTVYRWGAGAAGYRPQSKNHLILYQKRKR